ncbi:MAG TPA: alpha/beta hydrolase [Thermomicrobiales bacterium]|nr:alpha/beta hydrolase [Thermomicrobiales bacterium]
MTSEPREDLRTPDGIILSTATWEPDSPKAVVLLSHGHAEHIGRYAHVIEALTGHGYAVVGQDHRGHGRSGGERALAMRFDDYIDDFRLLADRTRERHPDLPRIVLGHSMGGLIAARYTLAWQQDVSALVICGAAFIIDEGVPAWQSTLVRVVSKVWPKAPVPRDDSDTLSTDPSVREAFHNDPLTYHGKTRMRTAVEMHDAGADALARASTLTVPLLAMHGAIDQLTSPRGTGQFFAAASSTDKSLKLWPGMKHEIFNEIDRATVIATMLDWLDDRFPATP